MIGQAGEGAAARLLIVNADDFGQSEGINRGVARAHDEGIVTSASLMVRWPAAESAAAEARLRPDLSVGLHLDFGEWDYDGAEWRPRYLVASLEDEGRVLEEVEAQLGRFRELIGADPTHIDSHQHVHTGRPLRTVARRLAEHLGVPLRKSSDIVTYSGAFYGQSGRGEPWPQALTVTSLVGFLHRLSPGITELGCHPADSFDLESMYGAERVMELATLCDPRVRSTIDELSVRLCSFRVISVLMARGRH